MAESLKFTCSQCDEVHEGLPDYGMKAPDYYFDVPQDEREARCELGSDLCTVDQEFFFVRTVLLVPIVGLEESFGWGVWSSLSQRNFQRYKDYWDSPTVDPESPYFGWLSNRLPFYPDTQSLEVRVHPQLADQRPLLQLKPTDHPLAVDQREGMSWARAVEMAEGLLHRNTQGSRE